MFARPLHLALLAVAYFAPVYGHVGRGVPHAHRGIDTPSRTAPLVRRQNEASAAQITNVAQEITPVNVPEVAAISGNFPEVWTTASILPSDSAAQSVWSAIQASNIIPSYVKVKGTPNGDFSSFTPTYDGATDPDCWWTYKQCSTPKAPSLVADVTSCPEPETWGFTLDDGPNATHNAFYDFLQTNNQKATLFYIGSNVLDWPLQAQRGLVDGHDICVHTWSHQYMTALSDEQVFAELYYTAKVIKDIIGITVRCWRPPFGDVDDRVRAIATGLGLRTIIWSEDTDDWTIDNPGVSTASIEGNYNSIFAKETQGAYKTEGNIVLTHEISGMTMDLLMQEYPTIKSTFKYVVPLTACMNNTNPYPEAISYPNFAQYISGNILASGLPNGNNIKASAATYTPQTGTNSAAAAAASTKGASGLTITSTLANKGINTKAAAVSAAATHASSGAHGSAYASTGAIAVGGLMLLLRVL